MPTVIKPTVGRVVLYRAVAGNPAFPADADHAALVAKVNDDGTLNLGVLDTHGTHHAMRNVPLVQDGETVPAGHYAKWMEFQLGQAAKTAAVERQLVQQASGN